MENRGLVDFKAKQDHFQRRRSRHQLNNFKSGQKEITLVELSASDVEILDDENSLTGKDIKITPEQYCFFTIHTIFHDISI